jgi:hypothetical protein
MLVGIDDGSIDFGGPEKRIIMPLGKYLQEIVEFLGLF